MDRSSLGLLVFTSIVLLLSAKDMFAGGRGGEAAADSKSASLRESLDSPLPTVNSDDAFETDDNTMESQLLDDDDHDDGTADRSAVKKEIPSLKMRSNQQILKFKFCYSCGYRNMYDQYSQIIRQRYPDIKIEGENYAPVAYKSFVAQFLSSFKLLLIASVMFGLNPFSYMNVPTPGIYTWASENKLYACLMTFFLSNMFEAHLLSTGAFEVYLNDIQIWSKLQSDRMPHEKELIQILDMNFNFDQKKNVFGAASLPNAN